jgi:hypothetical protein
MRQRKEWAVEDKYRLAFRVKSNGECMKTPWTSNLKKMERWKYEFEADYPETKFEIEKKSAHEATDKDRAGDK